MIWLVEGVIVIALAILVAYICCKCKECLDKFESK
jgi:hypothetical protein